MLAAVSQNRHGFADELEEIAVEGGNDDRDPAAVPADIAGDGVVGFPVRRFGVADPHEIESRDDVRKLRKGVVVVRDRRVIHAIGFVSGVQLRPPVGMLAVEEDEQMGGRYPPNDFEQGAGEAQRTLDRFSLLVPDPGRHPEKHLEQQVVAVDQEIKSIFG